MKPARPVIPNWRDSAGGIRPLKILRLTGLQPYEPVLHLQHRLVSARLSGTLETDALLLLQHEPVFTLGHNGGRENLKVSDAFLRSRGIKVIKTKRGGNITYHGPGQVIVYPIVNLRAARVKVTEYVNALEEALIRTAVAYGIPAHRNPPHPGVWVGEKKLGSIGIAVRHGVTYHGAALNVNLSLAPFRWIIPCGLEGVEMTSLKDAGALHVTCTEVMDLLSRHIKKTFGAKERATGNKTQCPVSDGLSSS